MNRRILITGGGTGGHVLPGLAVAARLQARGCETVWLGAKRGLETELVPAASIVLHTINIKGVRRAGILRLLTLPYCLCRALWQARRVYRRFRPDAVLSLGGFAAFPGGVMAVLCRVPLVLHEQNTVPSLTNRLLARFAKRSFIAFPRTVPPLRRSEYVGNPLRQALSAVQPYGERKVRQDGFTVLALGGSRGAAALNRVVPQGFGLLQRLSPHLACRVIHQCGAGHVEQTRAAYAEAGVRAEIQPFIRDMAVAYTRADVVICRAGSMTLSELAAVGVAAILIPYPYAVDDHQTRNAEFFVEADAALLLPQPALNARALCRRLRRLLRHDVLATMAVHARALRRTDAAERVAEYLTHV